MPAAATAFFTIAREKPPNTRACTQAFKQMSEKSQSLVISKREFRLSVRHERKAEAIDGEVAHQALRQALLET
jgi:hypothetical protein